MMGIGTFLLFPRDLSNGKSGQQRSFGICQNASPKPDRSQTSLYYDPSLSKL